MERGQGRTSTEVPGNHLQPTNTDTGTAHVQRIEHLMHADGKENVDQLPRAKLGIKPMCAPSLAYACLCRALPSLHYRNHCSTHKGGWCGRSFALGASPSCNAVFAGDHNVLYSVGRHIACLDTASSEARPARSHRAAH